MSLWSAHKTLPNCNLPFSLIGRGSIQEGTNQIKLGLWKFNIVKTLIVANWKKSMYQNIFWVGETLQVCMKDSLGVNFLPLRFGVLGFEMS